MVSGRRRKLGIQRARAKTARYRIVIVDPENLARHPVRDQVANVGAVCSRATAIDERDSIHLVTGVLVTEVESLRDIAGRHATGAITYGLNGLVIPGRQ